MQHKLETYKLYKYNILWNKIINVGILTTLEADQYSKGQMNGLVYRYFSTYNVGIMIL